MSERDSVHKEIEKLQEEVGETKKKMSGMESKTRGHDEERRRYTCQVEMLKREIQQALSDRDKAIKDAHELREKLGYGTSGDKQLQVSSAASVGKKFEEQRQKRASEKSVGGADSTTTSTEALQESANSTAKAAGDNLKGDNKEAPPMKKVENLEQANAEIERLRKHNEKLGGELQGKNKQA